MPSHVARDQCLAPERVDADAEGPAGWPFFRSVDPAWKPTLPALEPGRFSIADVVAPAADRAAA